MLPESITNLNNLEDVNFKFSAPPKEIKNWTNLRRFYYVKGSAPVGIGKLVSLQKLAYWVRDKVITMPECNDGIEELGNLNLLEKLFLCRLDNVKDPIDAEGANLKAKRNLRVLQLHWSDPEDEDIRWHQKSCNFQISEALQPHTSLRRLYLNSFMGSVLPKWMCTASSLPNLLQLKPTYCPGIERLPASIGQLPRLTYLLLSSMYLKSLNIGGFSSLYELHLSDMALLEELCHPAPRLQLLNISNCKSLTKIPSFTSLEQLTLEDVDHRLVNSILEYQTSLSLIILENIEDLEFFPISIMQLRNLRKLKVSNCDEFQGFRVINGDGNDIGNEVALFGTEIYIDCLQELNLIDCPVLKCLPDLGKCTSLQELIIFNCPLVKESLSYDLKSLPSLKKLYVDFIQRDEQRGDPSDFEDLVDLME